MSKLNNDDIATIEQAIMDKQKAILIEFSGPELILDGSDKMNDYQDLSLCLFKLELLKKESK